MLSDVSAKTVHITIDASIDGGEIRGQIRNGVRPARQFHGWLALISALDGLLSGTEMTPRLTDPDEWPADE
jgi:hypothetical protein